MDNIIIDKENSKKSRYKYTKFALWTISFIVLICFNTLFIFDLLNTSFTNRILYVVEQMFSAKPTTELFDDNSEVFFVAWLLNLAPEINADELSFVKPMNDAVVTSSNNVYYINGNQNVVYASESGKVVNIEVVNNIKSIYIEHGGGYVSKYSNIDYTGVIMGQIVDKSQPIASISETKNLIFTITIDNENLQLNFQDNGVIEFEN